jgi:putative membrane protein
MKEAIQADLSEVSAGQLAQQRGSNQQVKDFGKMLETEHGANLLKARTLAGQIGASPPTTVNDDQQVVFDRLSGLQGPEFDRTFVRAMIDDHKKDIARFQTQAKLIGPAADYAKQTLPTLQKHLQTAEALAAAKAKQ